MEGKTYVWVRARTDEDGRITPEAFRIGDAVLPIARVAERREARATKAGGRGTRYTILVGQTQMYLFMDEDRRWFLPEPDARRTRAAAADFFPS